MASSALCPWTNRTGRCFSGAGEPAPSTLSSPSRTSEALAGGALVTTASARLRINSRWGMGSPRSAAIVACQQLRTKADRGLLLDDDGTEPERKAHAELLERHVEDAPEDGRALLQLHDADGVRRVGDVLRRRHANDGVAGERALAGERHQ